MRHADFRIGAEFRCGGRLWRCTDIGTRAIVAIHINRVGVGGSPPLRRTLSGADADAEALEPAGALYIARASPGLRSRLAIVRG